MSCLFKGWDYIGDNLYHLELLTIVMEGWLMGKILKLERLEYISQITI